MTLLESFRGKWELAILNRIEVSYLKGVDYMLNFYYHKQDMQTLIAFCVRKTKTTGKNLLIALALIVLLTAPFAAVSANSNSDLQNKINALNEEVKKNQATLDEISGQANTLQNKVDSLNAEINSLQAKIDLANLQIEQTNQQIAVTKEKLDKQKKIMYENARTLYKEGDVSTIEILASSDNFSEFVNRQEYLTKVKENVNAAAREVVALKTQLEKKIEALKNFKIEQEVQAKLIGYKRDEQAQLLSETRGQESRYQSIVSANKAAIAQTQAELNSRMVGSSGGNFGSGSYPYASACMNPYLSPDQIGLHNCGVDSGGYFYRQCTSYAYWRRGNLGRAVPGFWGDAGNWAYSARAAGYNVNTSPAVGAIGVMGGGYGHVFIVEQVIDSNRVIASQYNFSGANGGQWGNYSVVTLNTSGLQFIHDR